MILCKDTSSKERTVSVGYGNPFVYNSINGYMYAKSNAEADAYSRLLQQYPDITGYAVSSYNTFSPNGGDGYWLASATGIIPGKPAEKDKTEKVTTGYGVVTDCIKRAKETAKKKLKKKYPGVKNITIECERTPEGGFVAKADGVVEKQTKTEKGIKMKTKKVNVGNGEMFFTCQYGTIEATKRAAEEDAKRRLLIEYPNAVKVKAHSRADLFKSYNVWYAQAEGEIPDNTTDQDVKQHNGFGCATNQNPTVHSVIIPIGVWFKNKADAYSYISMLLESQFSKNQGRELVSYKVNFTTKVDKQLYERGVPIYSTPGERIECTLEVEYTDGRLYS